MDFKLDENLPGELAAYFEAAGHDVMTVGQQRMIGGPDVQLASVCAAERRVLLTLDLGFADIRRYAPAEHAGLVVLRVTRQDKPHVVDVCRRIIALLARESPLNRLWIVEDARIRIRT